MNQLGDVERASGEMAKARSCYERALVAFRDAQDPWGAGRSLTDLGYIHLEEDRLDEARSVFREALEIFGNLVHRRGVARVLEGYATLALAGDDPATALKLAAAAARIRRQIDAPLSRSERARADATMQSAKTLLAASESDKAWKEGAAMPLDVAIAYALRQE
jgi:tetratricopeptide (TPR) repeat protein